MKKITTALLIFFISNTALAKDPDQSIKVKNFVNQIGKEIISIANEKGSESKKRDKIIEVIDVAIDSNWIARFVLGKNYRRANSEQRKKFTELYRKFMINTYGPKFKNYNGRSFEVKEVQKQRGFYVAKSEFLPRESNVPILVDFRVKERKGKLVILDFIAEGISLIETQRSEFNSAIAQKGIDNFLDDLSDRVEKLKKDQK